MESGVGNGLIDKKSVSLLHLIILKRSDEKEERGTYPEQ